MDTTITNRVTGIQLIELVAQYYSLETSDLNENDLFKWSSIIDYTKNNIYINKSDIVLSNTFNNKIDNQINEMNGYPLSESNIYFNSKLSDGTTIYIPDTVNQTLISRKRNKLYSEKQTINYQNTASELFSPYISILLKEKGQSPYFSPFDFTYGGAVRQSIQLASVSARVFVVCKSMGNKVINLSPYLLDCNWNDNENGGNFSFTLANITAEYENGQWVKRNHQVIQDNNNGFQFRHNDALNAYRIINSEYSNLPIDTIRQNYFEAVLQTGDVVFIRGERLFKENYESNIDTLEFCEVKDLVNRSWDCIGRIDLSQSDYNIPNGLVGFNIQGRDLFSLLIDEQSLVLPSLVSDGGSSASLSNYLATYVSFGEEQSKSRSVNRLLGKVQDIALVFKQPIPRLVDWIFDKLSNTPFTSDYRLFSEFKSSNPYKSFDEVNWITLKRQGKYERLGLWNLVSIWYDESIKNRYVQDGSLASSGGNIISFLKKICMPPLVELQGITLGSFYHLIIRRPPFGKKDYKNLFDTCNTNGSHVITSDKIINMNLAWDTQEIYSVYRFVPIELPLSPNEINYTYPAIPIPELMDRFGAKLWEVSSNYMDIENLNQAFKQATADLQWVIETQVYKPFSKKGSITMIGDRIIKKGEAVYLESLDLLCYVTGVSNQFSINETEVSRVTVLNVERCIRMKHYDKYFSICDFSKLNDNVDARNKVVSLTKDINGKPYIFDFFEQRKELDYDS